MRPGFGGGRRGPIGGGPFRGGRLPGRTRFGSRFYGAYPYGYGSPYGYGYIPSPLSYVGFPSDYQSDQAAAEASAEGSQGYYPPEDDLAGQVQQLGDQVAQLQQGQPYGGGAAPAAAPSEPLLPTVLVYRDGRQMDVQNYAIYGQTVWVFGDQITRKIAFADLDLAGTKKLNDQRGVEFDIPESR